MGEVEQSAMQIQAVQRGKQARAEVERLKVLIKEFNDYCVRLQMPDNAVKEVMKHRIGTLKEQLKYMEDKMDIVHVHFALVTMVEISKMWKRNDVPKEQQQYWRVKLGTIMTNVRDILNGVRFWTNHILFFI